VISPAVLHEIETDDFLKPMANIVKKFSAYLDYTESAFFGIRQLDYEWPDQDDSDPVISALDYDLPYTTRWSDDYRKNTLWKLYNLKYYYVKYPERLPKYTMMVTITGEHDSPRYKKRVKMGHMRYLEKHYYARKKLLDLVRKYLVDCGRIVASEGHPSSGMIHDHILYFLDAYPSPAVLDMIKREWNDKLGMGNDAYGVDIVIKEPKDFSDIASLVGYPMAYIGKNTSHGIPDWTKYDWVYNASIFWASKPKNQGGIGHNIRTIQPSHDLSKIMSCEYFPDDVRPFPEPKRTFVDSRLFKTYIPAISVEYEDGRVGLEYFRDPDELPYLVNSSKDWRDLREWKIYAGVVDVPFIDDDPIATWYQKTESGMIYGQSKLNMGS
jgi:hypothetical protein